MDRPSGCRAGSGGGAAGGRRGPGAGRLPLRPSGLAALGHGARRDEHPPHDRRPRVDPAAPRRGPSHRCSPPARRRRRPPRVAARGGGPPGPLDDHSLPRTGAGGGRHGPRRRPGRGAGRHARGPRSGSATCRAARDAPPARGGRGAAHDVARPSAPRSLLGDRSRRRAVHAGHPGGADSGARRGPRRRGRGAQGSEDPQTILDADLRRTLCRAGILVPADPDA